MCLTAGDLDREEGKELMQTFVTLRLMFGDEDGHKGDKEAATIPGCHRPPSLSYFHACPPWGRDGALGQSGKKAT